MVCAHLKHTIRDGEVSHPMVHRVAACASGPESESTRGVSAKLVKLMTDCGVDGPIKSTPGPILTHIVSPSDLLRFLHLRFPDSFKNIAGVDAEQLDRCWRKLKAAGHPAVQGLSPPGLPINYPTTYSRRCRAVPQGRQCQQHLL